MKKIQALALVAALLSSCSLQNKIKKVEIKESGFNTRIEFSPIKDDIVDGGVIYNITPLSPDKLNKFFINESTYDGKLEYSYFETSRDSYFLGRNKPEKVSKKKSDWEYFMEGINWLLDKNEISKEEYYQYAQMFSDVYEDEENADEELEVKAETPDLNRFIIANPYYVGNKYLSLFKLDVSNSTDTFVCFNGDFHIEIGTTLLEALNKNEIIELLEVNNLSNQLKLHNLERHHLPCTLMVPPNSQFTKYIASRPFAYDNQTLAISTSGIDDKTYWEIEQSHDSISKVFTYYLFDLKHYIYSRPKTSQSRVPTKKELQSYSRRFNIISSGHSFAILNGNEVYIDAEELESEFEIASIAIAEDKLYFGRSPLRANDYLDFKKSKRRPLENSLENIPELKRKK